MTVIGLTGSIAMGKSTAAGMFREMGIPVFSADDVVRTLRADNPNVIAEIDGIFPGVVEGGILNVDRLRDALFQNYEKLKSLEAIFHPHVREKMHAFIDKNADQDFIILDIPLLFEGGLDSVCDATIVVTAPAEVQKERVLARDGMDEDMLAKILSSQMPDADKCDRADFVVSTDKGVAYTQKKLEEIIKELRAQHA